MVGIRSHGKCCLAVKPNLRFSDMFQQGCCHGRQIQVGTMQRIAQGKKADPYEFGPFMNEAKPPSVFIVADLKQRIADQLRLAEALAAGNAMSFHFLVAGDCVENWPIRIRERGFSFTILRDLPDVPDQDLSFQPKPWGSFTDQVLSVFPQYKKVLVYGARTFEKLYCLKNQVVRLMSEFKPRAVLTNGDRHLGLEPAVLAAAKEFGTEVIIPNIAYFADAESCYQLRAVNPSFQIDPLKKLLLFPLLGQAYKNCFFYLPSHMLALKKLGTLSNNPWFMGHGSSDKVCVSNQIQADQLLKSGVPKSKIRLVGDLSFDQLYQGLQDRNTLRKAINDACGFDSNKPLIVTALPHLAEQGRCTWDEHFRHIRHLMGELQAVNGSLLVSLHPRCRFEDYTFLEREFKCVLSERRLLDLLPAADLFVAGYSSTVLWAVLCGIPAVVCAFYETGWNDYQLYDNVTIIDGTRSLVPIFRSKLQQDGDFGPDWRNLARDQVFDGRTLGRYRELLHAPLRDFETMEISI